MRDYERREALLGVVAGDDRRLGEHLGFDVVSDSAPRWAHPIVAASAA